MRRVVSALLTAAAVGAFTAAPASAGQIPVVTPPDQMHSGPTQSITQSNDSTTNQGDNSATGGNADATGGNGGDANSGNEQFLNGNSVAVSIGKDSKADSSGGDTSAQSGDATGGNGGNAKAEGGDASVENKSGTGQSNSAENKSSGDSSSQGDRCGCDKRPSGPSDGKGNDQSSTQSNDSTTNQGNNSVTGGDANATGGNGGDANTGNEQFGNGNSFAYSQGQQQDGTIPLSYSPCSCSPGKDRGSDTSAESRGGDTSAKSGDAYGGNGGDAKAKGGDAWVDNKSFTWQSNDAKNKGGSSDQKSGWEPKSMSTGPHPQDGQSIDQYNDSTTDQGSNTVTGGKGEAYGGDGGYADTGNIQKGNGNSWSYSDGQGNSPMQEKHAVNDACYCNKRPEHKKSDDTSARSSGGDTSAESGDAYGGNGGDAKAFGGDAWVVNKAFTGQSNEASNDKRK